MPRRRYHPDPSPSARWRVALCCWLVSLQLNAVFVTGAALRRRTDEVETTLIKEFVDLVEDNADDDIKKDEQLLLDAVVQDVEELIEDSAATEEEPNDNSIFQDDDDALFSGPTPIYQKSPSTNLLLPWISAIGILGMIFTAWQMADHPDGIYSSLCRMIVDFIRFILFIAMTPCRKCCGRHNEPYGRISTMDYGYAKNPALELS